MAISLFAIHQGAEPLQVGLLMSLFALVPMLCAVTAGKWIDRIGAKKPVFWSAVALAVAASAPVWFPSLAALYVASAGIGLAFTIFHLAIQHTVGSLADGSQRANHFSWLALGFSISGFIGPVTTGFTIDHAGQRAAFAVLAIIPLLAVAAIASLALPWPGARAKSEDHADHGSFALMKSPPIRNVLIANGILAMGWDVFNFMIPIYGTRQGFSASTIGSIIGAFAMATFCVRLVMPWLVAHLRPWQTITGAMSIACIAYALFPLADSAPLLMALAFMLGLGLGSTQPMVLSLIHDVTPPNRTGEAMGIRSTIMNLSHTVLPLLLGGMGTALGVGPAFATVSACFAAGGWFSFRRARQVNAERPA